MLGSKIDYILCGFSIEAALISALIHDGLGLTIYCILAILMYYTAEHKRKVEETLLLSKNEEEKSSEE